MPALEDIPQNCDVVLVVEQSPVQDDVYGRVYSGKGLAEIRAFFEQSGIHPYCTYALKCVRPSKDVKPDAKQVKICANEYLAKELVRLKPKHIITFGSNAHYGVTHKKCTLEKMGNRYFDESLQAYIYPTNHWIQGIYNQQVKDQIWANLRRFVEWINGGAEALGFRPQIYMADSLRSLQILRKRIARDAGGVVAVDIETQGLNPYIPGQQVRSIQFCWDTDFGGVFVPLGIEEDCYYTSKRLPCSFWQEESLEEAVGIIREILADTACVWHNGKFDRLWLHEWGKREFGKPILAPHIYMDTLHVAHLLDENRSLKLKQLITSELGYPTYDIPDKLTKDLDVLIPYAAKDTVASLLLAQKYVKMLKTLDLSRLRKLYTRVIRPMDTIFTKMELSGWPVDRDSCLELRKVVTVEFKKVEADLHDILAKYGIEVSSKAFASPKQLTEIIFGRLQYPVNPDRRLSRTATGGLSTGSDALLHLKGKPFVDKLLEWRGMAKMLSTYIEPMIEAAETRGRVTTSYRLTGTVTGRTASGKENQRKGTSSRSGALNLQNLPYTKYGSKKLSVRNCIRAREGWSIMEVDYSQIELRVAGELSKDPLLLKAYQEGQDIHMLRAMRMIHVTPEEWEQLSPEVRKDKRQKAKAVSFGFLFGMLAPRFQQYALNDYGLDLSIEDCKKIRAQFFADHGGLQIWYGKQEREAHRKGYVENLSGRRRHLPNIRLDPESSREAKGKYLEAVRMAINSPVQSFASDLKLMSLIQIYNWLDPKDGYLFGEVHDSLVLEVRNTVLEDVARSILQIMSHPQILDKLGIQLTVPICAEVKAGPSLGEAVELKL
jgi:DNA polymerase-1